MGQASAQHPAVLVQPYPPVHSRTGREPLWHFPPLVSCMLVWAARGTQDCRWTPVGAATPFPHPHPAKGHRVPFYSWSHWKVEEIAQDDTATLLTLASLVPQGLPLGDRGVQGQQEDSIHLESPPLLLRADKRKDLSWPSGMAQASREA